MKHSILLAFLLLTACGGRPQVQLVSDARAGGLAYEKAGTPEQRAKIAAGVVHNLLAATSRVPGLPAPTTAVEEILADPDAYDALAVKSAADPPPYRPEDQPKGSAQAKSILTGVGGRLLEYGAYVGSIGLGLMVCAWFGLFATIFAAPFVLPLIRMAASTGAIAAIVGAALMYLADYIGWVVAIGFLSVPIAVVIHWKDIKTLWTKVKERRAAVVAKVQDKLSR